MGLTNISKKRKKCPAACQLSQEAKQHRMKMLSWNSLPRTMRNLFFYSLLLVALAGRAQKKMTPEEYIARYKDDAVKEMYLHKIPACITLAQGMLESSNGNSELARVANNHFGIKCHKEWSGDTYTMDDDEKGECFRKYNDVLDSYDDHSMFLLSRSRYSPLFELSLTDYRGWANGLRECGYATNPKYPQQLIELIEKYKLYELYNVESVPNQKFPAHAEIKTEMVIRNSYRFNHIKFVISRPGDSYYRIASEFNLELDRLLEYNDFSEDEKLQPGQKIYIERKRRKAMEPYHVVQKNETLRSVSQLHGIRMSSLCRKNRLKPDDMLKVGDVLYLRSKKPSGKSS